MRAALAAIGVSVLALGPACRFEPARPVLRYELAEATRATDEDGRPRIPLSVQDHIRGSLEMLFGTPSNPQYMLLGDWIDEGFDPNWPSYEAGDMGSGEFAPEQLEALWSDNARAFRRELAAIGAGRYGDVEPPDWAPDLASRWRDLLAEVPSEERDEAFAEEATAVFEQWYPTLGDSAELFRQQCLHCHGPEGGGNGPTADFLDPRPRDYRKGIFKFTPMRDKAQPRREDLYRILDEGVTGTSMPSFRRFSHAQLHGLVDYVRLLSMRGMVEADLAATYEIDEAIPAEYVVESYRDVFAKWTRSEEEAVELVISYEDEIPAPTPESIAHGRELFMDAKTGNCFSCHGPAGRGDGLSAWTVDPETGAVEEAYLDDWGQPIRPRNLTQGIFRGGRRPIDIFRRIKAGINGTPMPALGGTLPDEDLWAIVHYVGTLTESGLFYPEDHEVSASAGH
jgi:mono/diheme cytochrome c family protein